MGDQLLFLDLVWNFRFLSLSWGPIALTSTKGRNMPDVCHFRSLAPMTEREKKRRMRRSGTAGRGRPCIWAAGQTFDGDLSLAAAGLRVQLYLD